MKQRFSESQIISILKQSESGQTVAELCREHGMSSTSFYKWRSKYGGMEAYHNIRDEISVRREQTIEAPVCRKPAAK